MNIITLKWVTGCGTLTTFLQLVTLSFTMHIFNISLKFQCNHVIIYEKILRINMHVRANLQYSFGYHKPNRLRRRCKQWFD